MWCKYACNIIMYLLNMCSYMQSCPRLVSSNGTVLAKGRQNIFLSNIQESMPVWYSTLIYNSYIAAGLLYLFCRRGMISSSLRPKSPCLTFSLKITLSHPAWWTTQMIPSSKWSRKQDNLNASSLLWCILLMSSHTLETPLRNLNLFKLLWQQYLWEKPVRSHS